MIVNVARKSTGASSACIVDIIKFVALNQKRSRKFFLELLIKLFTLSLICLLYRLKMVSITQRLSVATLVLALILISITETAANPGQEQHDVNSVADAIRYLQDLENRHQFARPR